MLLRVLVVTGIFAGLAVAQDEMALRKAFEGKKVQVKIDMPGDVSGVDVRPDSELPVDFPTLGRRVKRYGVSVREGDVVMVTQIKVKEKLIEFQLGGGGFGSFGDKWSLPSVPSSSHGESSEERRLKREIRSEKDDSRRRSLERQLSSARRRREYDERRNAGEIAQAKIERERLEMSKRETSGSRFNIRYEQGVPASALTPDALMKTLEKYVDFGGPR